MARTSESPVRRWSCAFVGANLERPGSVRSGQGMASDVRWVASDLSVRSDALCC